MVEEMHIHLDHIFNRNEIAQLSAVRVTVATFKQFDPAFRPILVEEVVGDRGHASFVRFAGAVYVEVTQAHDLRTALVPAAPHNLIKQKFGVSVYIQRGLVFAAFLEYAAAAIHRGG